MAEVALWRLVRPKYAPGLDGLGAKRVGGRWNSPGQPAVYCATNLSLAILETFVHLPPTMRTAEMLPRLSCVRLEVAEEALIDLDAAALTSAGAATSCRDLGDKFLKEGKSVGLRVPSMVVPIEFNVVLNPLHRAFGNSVRVVSVADFEYDPRLAD